MTHNPRALQRYHETHFKDGYISWHHYATNHTLAEVLVAGFFNTSVSSLRANDVIQLIADVDGTPAPAAIRVTAATVGADVTTELISSVLGQTNIADVTLGAVTGVDGTGGNAASKADVDARLTTIQTAINAILANLEASGINAGA